MKNPRLTAKDRGAIKGFIRRAFSRSELRLKVLRDARVQHADPARPRVKTWCLCKACGKPEAISNCVVDHILPLVPVHLTLEDLSWDDVVNYCWSDASNLQVLDITCHKQKTKLEQQERKRLRSKK